MKQVTSEEFSKLLKNDEAMAKRLADYVVDVKDPDELQKKTMEFAKKEGYEFTLSADELADVSGGAGIPKCPEWITKIYVEGDKFLHSDNIKSIRRSISNWFRGR